jgi:ElaB/YqjD/DUF883 family membrane-anchored ribosome-binding protein
MTYSNETTATPRKARNGSAADTVADTADAVSADVQDAISGAGDRIAKAADAARDVIAEATAQAAAAYEEIRDRARQAADTVDPFVKGRPYAALAIVGVVGLVFGALFFSRGARVIYVKPAPAS